LRGASSARTPQAARSRNSQAAHGTWQQVPRSDRAEVHGDLVLLDTAVFRDGLAIAQENHPGAWHLDSLAAKVSDALIHLNRGKFFRRFKEPF
jgi:hypothetical protein